MILSRKMKARQVLLMILPWLYFFSVARGQNSDFWIHLEPEVITASTRHIVLISGDEEYRSEEGLPMLAKLLTEHHGFRTTVLFPIDPETGWINPNNQENIPGLEHLQSADLMIIQTRFRNLPDSQMKYIDDFIRAGKPVIGLRTATHAFNFPENSESHYRKYSFNSKTPEWEKGFGNKIFGETWVDHHGIHGKEGTRGLVDGLAKRNHHPVVTGVEDIWGSTDVYTISAIPEGAEVMIWGLSTSGMTEEAPVNWKKSIMPVAWTKTYRYSPDSPQGRVFVTTMGAATDLTSPDLRRLIINAVYWSMGMKEQINTDLSVDIPFNFTPTPFGFNGFVKGKKPKDYE